MFELQCPTADNDQNARTSYFNLPALDVSIAFPQATPASKFPPCGKNNKITHSFLVVVRVMMEFHFSLAMLEFSIVLDCIDYTSRFSS